MDAGYAAVGIERAEEGLAEDDAAGSCEGDGDGDGIFSLEGWGVGGHEEIVGDCGRRLANRPSRRGERGQPAVADICVDDSREWTGNRRRRWSMRWVRGGGFTLADEKRPAAP